MKITINKDAEGQKLIKAMVSKNKVEAYEAQAKITTSVGPVMEKVLNAGRVLSSVFKDFSYDDGTYPTIPLDLYHDHTTENEIQVWSQSAAGGLATNEMVPYTQEMPFRTFTIESAISFDSKHAKSGNGNVVARSLDRLAQEILLKEENYTSNIILSVLAANYAANLTTSVANSVLQVEDFNAMILRSARAYKSWTGGTTADASQTVTDMFVSPERMKDLRAMAYNPINTKGANQVTGTADSGVVAAPDAMRASLFGAGGIREFYGINLVQFLEFGPGQKYSELFGTYLAAAGGTWNALTDDIMLGFDMTKEFAYRAIATDGEGKTLALQPDDQFLSRQKKVGFYGGEELGYMVLDKRPIVGLRIKAS